MIPIMTEERYYEEDIENIFEPYIHKKIVIYGIAGRTSIFLEKCPEHNVIGLMDSRRIGEYRYGKKILSLEEVEKEKPDIMIILAKEESTAEIYPKVYNFCKKNHIMLLNRFGRDLMFLWGEAFRAVDDIKIRAANIPEFNDAVANSSVIYFEFVDTLFVSQCLENNDFYKLDEKKRLKSLIPRVTVLEVFKENLKLDKEIYILCDSLEIKEYAAVLMERFGASEYREILLYDEIKQENRGLYVGNNTELSVRFSKYYYIPSPYEMLAGSAYRELLNNVSTWNERALAGMFTASIFNNPFMKLEEDKRIIIDKDFDLGYLFVGPLAVSFMLWAIDEIRNNNYNAVLFGARDGYIFQKLYDQIRQKAGYDTLPESIYFETSRKLCINSGMMNAKEIEGTAQHPYIYSPDFMLQNKYNVNPQDIDVYDVNKYTNVVSYVLAHKEYILEASKNLRVNYLNYMKRIGLKEEGKYLFFDLCSCGTCQYFLNNFIPFTLDAVYLCFYRSHDYMRKDWKDILHYKSFFENGYSFDCATNVFIDYCFMETFATSFVPSIIGMDKDGSFVYGKENRKKEELEYVRDVQAGILKFCTDFLDIMHNPNEKIANRVPDRLYSFRSKTYTSIKCDILDGLTLSDEWGKYNIPIELR